MEVMEKTYKMIALVKPLEVNVKDRVKLFDDVFTLDPLDYDSDESERSNENKESMKSPPPPKDDYVTIQNIYKFFFFIKKPKYLLSNIDI
jgi:hypothetical protein